VLAVMAAQAQTAVQVWVQRYNGTGNSDDTAVATAVDGSGNVLVTGSSWGSGSYYDYATIKYSSMGVPLWINRYNGPGNHNDGASAIALDAAGSAIVTGTSIGSGSGNDYVTIKYSSTGMPLWTNRYDGSASSDDHALAIAVDGNGNAFVTGVSASTNGPLYRYQYATIKYSSEGAPLWTNRYGGPANYDDWARAIAVDSSGNVFVTGNSASTNTFPYNYDYSTIKYSSAGVPLWTNRYNGLGNRDDQALAMATDTSGNVFVCGVSATDLYNDDYATIKYSSMGVPMWTNRYDGPGNDSDIPNAIAVDTNGNVFVTGASYGANSVYDYATISYSSAGVPLWTNRFDGAGNSYDHAVAIAVGSNGKVFVSGESRGLGSSSDYATIGYSSAGFPLWTNLYNGPTTESVDQASAIAVDADGNVFVTGYSTGNGSSSDYATIKYSSSVPPTYLEIQTPNNQLVLSWTNEAFSLQSASTLTGTFTNLPGATSPYTNPISGGQQFFRLISN